MPVCYQLLLLVCARLWHACKCALQVCYSCAWLAGGCDGCTTQRLGKVHFVVFTMVFAPGSQASRVVDCKCVRAFHCTAW